MNIIPDDAATPVGEGDYVVEDGDCLFSISESSGHFWETLWNLPANAALKEARGDPNVLLPGDRLTIPSIEPKSVSIATGKRHVFRRRGVPCQLRVRFLCGGEPRAGEAFVVAFEAAGEARGTLDEEGRSSREASSLRLRSCGLPSAPTKGTWSTSHPRSTWRSPPWTACISHAMPPER